MIEIRFEARGVSSDARLLNSRAFRAREHECVLMALSAPSGEARRGEGGGLQVPRAHTTRKTATPPPPRIRTVIQVALQLVDDRGLALEVELGRESARPAAALQVLDQVVDGPHRLAVHLPRRERLPVDAAGHHCEG